MGSVEELLRVSRAVEAFAAEVADAMCDGRPERDREQIRAFVSTDGWILATDVGECFAGLQEAERVVLRTDVEISGSITADLTADEYARWMKWLGHGRAEFEGDTF